MTKDEIVTSLRACVSADLNCCKTCPAAQEDGCEDAIKVYAADLIENQQREIEALRQAKWVPVTERLPEVWRNDETAELVNYMIYSPDFGVDIGNYHAKAKKWFCMALPCTVTHWAPLPPAPEA